MSWCRFKCRCACCVSNLALPLKRSPSTTEQSLLLATTELKSVYLQGTLQRRHRPHANPTCSTAAFANCMPLLLDERLLCSAATDRVLMHYSDQLVPVIETPAGLFETARVVASVRGPVLSWLVPRALPKCCRPGTCHYMYALCAPFDGGAGGCLAGSAWSTCVATRSFRHQRHLSCRHSVQVNPGHHARLPAPLLCMYMRC